MKEIKVLIVEDEAIVANDLKETLKGWGHAVLGIACSGEAAIHMIAEGQPDLVLMDIVLQGDADGIETAAQVRGRFDIPVIFVTAHADDEMLRRARVTEPFGYVLKPFDEQELHVNIQMALYKHEMERKLRESEARYRAIVEDQTELVCRFDLDTTLTFVNDAYCRYFGQEREGLIGRSFLTLIPGEEHETVRDHLASLASTSRKATHEHRVVAADGNVRWLQWSDRAICDGQGRVVEVQSVGRDTTERVRAEKKARRRTAQLQALREVGLEITAQLDLDALLHSIVSQAVNLLQGGTGCFCLYRPERKVLERVASAGDHPPSTGAILHRGKGIPGYIWETGESLVVNNLRDWWEGRGAIFEGCPTAAVVGAPVKWGDEFMGVLTVRTLDDSTRTFSSFDGKLMDLFVTQAAIAIKNARLYEDAHRDAETRAMLLREIDHRVKNNLTGIIGLLYTARRHARVKDQATYQSVMNDLIGRVRGLAEVHNMLSASRWTPLLLSDLAGGMIHAALHALPAERHVLLDIIPSPVRVTPDQAYSLALVINELATNAVKHALGERGALHIAFQIASDDGVVRCEFRDDGPGYPEHALQLERHGVGFDLIQNIVRDNLDGDFTLRNDHGAVALVRFRAAPCQ